MKWCHWLEGAKHPFEVITNQCNLEYLRDDKPLNPRQACWALFFTQFNFIVIYRTGSKNQKADALSCIHCSNQSIALPEPILPAAMIIGPIQWSINDQISEATRTEPALMEFQKGRFMYLHLWS